ncbi:MAG: hypothetical protein IJ627_02035 [Bacteroidales bacterium]|nr:hypothetical protein [Bacteroidales bacterium]
MSKTKEMTDVEFKEIVIGEYGPNIEKTLKQAEDNKARIIAIVNGYNQQVEYLNRLLKERKTTAEAVQSLENEIRSVNASVRDIKSELQEVSGILKGKDFKELTRQRTDTEWLWQKLAIFFMVAFGVSCIIGLF